jgi:putative spermidine/putrescine transport system substrate-binding protein
VLPEDLARQVSLTEAERARLLKTDYAYTMQRSTQTLDFWNKQFKG